MNKRNDPIKKMTLDEKVVLLLSLVPYLKEKGATSVSDLAQKFNVTEEAIRSLATIISMAGIPGETLTYQHQDLFDIDWDAFENDDVLELVQTIGVDDTPKFSSAEGAALLAGLNLLHDLLPESESDKISELQNKLAVATNSPLKSLTVAEAQKPPKTVSQLLQLTADRKQVSFNYLNLGSQTSTRTVYPVRVSQVADNWYFSGYCFLRNDTRHFRIENISDLKAVPKEQQFEVPPDAQVAESVDAFEMSTQNEVTVKVSGQANYLISSWNPTLIKKSEDSSEKIYKISLVDDSKALQLVSVAPGLIEILEPLAVRKLVANWLEDSLKRF